MAGLCLAAALSVMAFAAAAAQAEVGSHWNVNGSAISATLLPVPGATLENNHGQLLSHALGGTPLNILCTAVTFENAVLKAEGGSLGKIKFSGCTINNGKEVLPACEPVTGTEKGVVLTVLLKDLIVLEASGIAGEGYDLLEPEEGTQFVNIATAGECAFGTHIPVIGKFVFKDCNLEGKVEKVTHLTEEGPGTELWVISKTNEHKATIDGSANVFLTGAHEGLKWSGTPA
jgi:hypothetical protein